MYCQTSFVYSSIIYTRLIGLKNAFAHNPYTNVNAPIYVYIYVYIHVSRALNRFPSRLLHISFKYTQVRLHPLLLKPILVENKFKTGLTANCI